jgi:hypothetical protein
VPREPWGVKATSDSSRGLLTSITTFCSSTLLLSSLLDLRVLLFIHGGEVLLHFHHNTTNVITFFSTIARIILKLCNRLRILSVINLWHFNSVSQQMCEKFCSVLQLTPYRFSSQGSVWQD